MAIATVTPDTTDLVSDEFYDKPEVLYKLVRADRTTRGGVVWNTGDTKYAGGSVSESDGMCTARYVHAYRNMNQAGFMAPLYGYSEKYRVLEVKGIVERDDGTKVGCESLTVLSDKGSEWTTGGMKLTEFTDEERIAIAILAAPDPSIETWALNWLNGTDRSLAAAQSALEIHWAAKPATVSSEQVAYEAAKVVERMARRFVITLRAVVIARDPSTWKTKKLYSYVPLEAIVNGILGTPQSGWFSLYGTYYWVPPDTSSW